MIAPRQQHHVYTLPYTVIVDSREQHPYGFTGFKCDADRQYIPMIVPTEIAGLRTGDYSIKGLESEVCVERKSLDDLYSTISQRRRQFENEHLRMQEMKCAAVVVEASMVDLLMNPPERSRILPKVIYRTLISWQQRYGIPWYLCETRKLAERTTFRILDWYWEERRRLGNANS